MAIGLLGKKIGMTQIFQEDGAVIPVTLIEVGPCRVVQVKTKQPRKVERLDRNNRKYFVTKTDGYDAVQLGFQQIEKKNIKKPLLGHFGQTSKSKQLGKKPLTPMRHLREFRVADASSYQPGDELRVDLFTDGETVKIIGTSKGRGMAGVVKRYHFKAAKASHGTHEYFRHGGSIGQHTYPGRVWKGMKMAGHLGNARVTTRNVSIVKVDAKENILFVKGAVPGYRGGLVEIRKIS